MPAGATRTLGAMQRIFALLLVFVLAASACSASTTTATSTTDATSQSDTASSTDDDDADESDADESDTDAGDAADAAEPTAVPTPEPTATAEPTPGPADDVSDEESSEATAMLERSSLGDDLSPSEIACVVKGLAGQPDLLANAISGTDFDELPLDDQVDTALIAMDCAPEAAASQFTDGFTNRMTQAQPEMSDELGECLVGQLSADNPARREVMIGFASLGEDLPVPAEAEEALVDSISLCVPGPVFAEWLIAEFADDPQMANAIDTECIRSAFPDETIRQFWGAMVSQGGSMDDVDAEATAPLMNALFSCLSMGQIMADQAAQDGIDLSDETITCIDTEMADEDLAAMMSGNDPAGEARVTSILIGCLSPEELAGLGG